MRSLKLTGEPRRCKSARSCGNIRHPRNLPHWMILILLIVTSLHETASAQSNVDLRTPDTLMDAAYDVATNAYDTAMPAWRGASDRERGKMTNDQANAAAFHSEQVSVDGELRDDFRVTRSGSDVPLRDALKMIVPANYTVYLADPGPWSRTPVSWQKDRPLVQALRDVLFAHPELSAQIDGDFHLVTITYRAPAAWNGQDWRAHEPTPSLESLPLPAGGSSGAAVGLPRVAPPLPPGGMSQGSSTSGSSQSGVAGHAALVSAPPMVWRLSRNDGTVKTVLTRWAARAGWQLIWEAPVDFPIDADATIDGSFEDALQSVVAALSSSTAPIQAILYEGNKVLRIVSKGAG